MLFMVIERFRNRDAGAVYRRFREKGRMLPDGLKYVDSWVETNFDRCFQLMECDDVQLFQEWVSHWDDLVEFEIVAVNKSRDARPARRRSRRSTETPTRCCLGCGGPQAGTRRRWIVFRRRSWPRRGPHVEGAQRR